MTNLPGVKVTTIKRYEWAIGEYDESVDAKEFGMGIRHAEAEMKALGVDMSYDDCYRVTGVSGQIVLYVEIKQVDS